MKRIIYSIFLLAICCISFMAKNEGNFYKGNHEFIQYTGRVDFSNSEKPKFWASGAYVQIKFSGTYCKLQINDELLWGKINNYLEIKVDDQPAYRIQLKGKENILTLAQNLPKGEHTILICKNTEFENGYVEIVGFNCEKLLKPAPKQKRRIEFIGDSITCGAASDESEIKCDKGQWHDQHNAYMAYGPTTARNLNAQWHLSSVSGIGLMHSCCDKKIVMPQVFDKVNMARDTIKWDFNLYQPDVVTVCLGQNDGVQDSVQFTSAYIKFAKTLRAYYPKAKLVFLSSPMASKELKAALVKYINAVQTKLIANGDKNVGSYFFAKKYTKGCGSHPSVMEHAEIGAELTAYLKKTMRW
jgi:lysophospholipase L1-like esterase